MSSGPNDARASTQRRTEDEFAGRVAVITGGSRGIGLACAAELAGAGAKVAITGRSRESLQAAQASLGEQCMIFEGDASKAEDIDACLRKVMQRFGRIDILVNNAGGPLEMGAMVDVPVANLDATWELNLRGPFLWIQGAWLLWMREHGGVVLNMASLGGISLQPGMGAYSLSKAAMLHMTRILAAELSPKVRVNAIAPGVVSTDATADFIAAGGPAMASRLPLQRFGNVQDIADACRFLVSDKSSWTTGETLVIDGGSLVQWGRIRSAPAKKGETAK